MTRRTAYAGVVDGTLAWGDPQRRHLLVAPDTLTYRTPGNDRVIPWTTVEELAVAAPRSRFRFPGTVRTAGAMILAAVGMDDVPDTADLEVRLRTADGIDHLPCDGFLGNGYWEPHTVALGALADLLATDPATRPALTDPQEVLAAVAQVSQPRITPGAAARALRGALAQQH